MTLQWIRTYESAAGYIESVCGVDWSEAGVPLRPHICYAQSRGRVGGHYVERCPCGAIRDTAHGPWAQRNETRKQRRQSRKLAKMPRISLTCRDCGNGYQVTAGGAFTSEQCGTCWARGLVKQDGQ